MRPSPHWLWIKQLSFGSKTTSLAASLAGRWCRCAPPPTVHLGIRLPSLRLKQAYCPCLSAHSGSFVAEVGYFFGRMRPPMAPRINGCCSRGPSERPLVAIVDGKASGGNQNKRLHCHRSNWSAGGKMFASWDVNARLWGWTTPKLSKLRFKKTKAATVD